MWAFYNTTHWWKESWAFVSWIWPTFFWVRMSNSWVRRAIANGQTHIHRWNRFYTLDRWCERKKFLIPFVPLALIKSYCSKIDNTGIVLVRPSADFRPFSTNFRPHWDQYKSAKIMDLYMRGRPPRKGQNPPKSAQSGLFQPCECSIRTIPVIVML